MSAINTTKLLQIIDCLTNLTKRKKIEWCRYIKTKKDVNQCICYCLSYPYINETIEVSKDVCNNDIVYKLAIQMEEQSYIKEVHKNEGMFSQLENLFVMIDEKYDERFLDDVIIDINKALSETITNKK